MVAQFGASPHLQLGLQVSPNVISNYIFFKHSWKRVLPQLLSFFFQIFLLNLLSLTHSNPQGPAHQSAKDSFSGQDPLRKNFLVFYCIRSIVFSFENRSFLPWEKFGSHRNPGLHTRVAVQHEWLSFHKKEYPACIWTDL